MKENSISEDMKMVVKGCDWWEGKKKEKASQSEWQWLV